MEVCRGSLGLSMERHLPLRYEMAIILHHSPTTDHKRGEFQRYGRWLVTAARCRRGCMPPGGQEVVVRLEGDRRDDFVHFKSSKSVEQMRGHASTQLFLGAPKLGEPSSGLGN
jgi:hypothetical protein